MTSVMNDRPPAAVPPSTNLPREAETVETLVSRVGTLAAAAAGAVGFVYVVGGAVMWLRFWRSGLPADQAVALVPSTQLIVVGMRVMIIPALAAGLLFLFLAARSSGRLVPRRPLQRWLLRGLLVVPAVLALVVPLAAGAFAWPLAALALWLVWWKLIDPSRVSKRSRTALIARAALAAALASAFVSIARQFDHPVKLPSVRLTVEGTPGSTTGVLIYAGSDAVVLGLPEERGLTSYRRANVTSILVGPSLDRRPPQRSLLSLALGGEAWAATPLELWCGGESYGWNRLGVLCQTQPRIVVGSVGYTPETNTLKLKIDCPEQSVDGCSGFITLTTRERFVFGDVAKRAPIELGSTTFQVQRNGTVPVELELNARQERCLRDALTQPVALFGVLSSDRAAEAPLNGTTGQKLAVQLDKVHRDRSGACTAPIAPSASDASGDGSGDSRSLGASGASSGSSSGEVDGGGGGGTTGGSGDSRGGEKDGAKATETPTPVPSKTARELPATPPDPDDPVVIPGRVPSAAG
jgi:uncharacterized membrane protein YgcG